LALLSCTVWHEVPVDDPLDTPNAVRVTLVNGDVLNLDQATTDQTTLYGHALGSEPALSSPDSSGAQLQIPLDTIRRIERRDDSHRLTRVEQVLYPSLIMGFMIWFIVGHSLGGID
jgi:hypothetical protein